MKLSNKRQRFVDEYLIDLNATQAAERAGYSAKTARAQGQFLLTIVDVAKEIQRQKAKRQKRTGISQDRTLTELSRLGFSDVRKLFTEGGWLKDISALDDDTAAAVSSVKVVTRQTATVDEDGNREVEHIHEVKLWDKNSALEKIMKHLGVLADKQDVSGKLVIEWAKGE